MIVLSSQTVRVADHTRKLESVKKFTAITVIWVLALGACAAIVKLTSIGPVVFVISNELGMGVHTGDALVLIPLSLALLATFLVARRQVA